MDTTLCRFCLTTIKDQNFEAVTEFTREIVNVLLLKIDLDITLEPVICSSCSKNLQQFFDFKCTCLYSEDSIVPFMKSGENTPIDLREVYINREENENLTSFSDDQICRLCMQLIIGNCKSLNGAEKDMTSIKNIIQKHFPEVNLTITDNPIICEACYDSLTNHYRFVNDCLEVEKVIKEFNGIKETDISRDIKLPNIKFTVQNKNCSIDVDNIDIDQDQHMTGNKTNDHGGITNLNIDLKCGLNDQNNSQASHKESFQKSNTISEQMVESDGRHAQTGENSQTVTSRGPFITPIQPCKYCVRKRRKIAKKNLHFEEYSTVKIQGCKRCVNSIKLDDLKYLVFKYSTLAENFTRYQCRMCLYKAKTRLIFKAHIIMHKFLNMKKVYVCNICKFETSKVSVHDTHVTTHKLPIKCDFCEYKTKRDYCLRKHVRIHFQSV